MPSLEQDFVRELVTFSQKNAGYKKWGAVSKKKDLAFSIVISKLKRKIYKVLGLLLGVLASYWLYNIDILDIVQESECLVPFPERFIDMFRPSVGDCGFCQIDSIPTRSNITDVEFYEKYAYSGMPVLVTDGMKGWETDQFNLQFFKELYSNVTLGQLEDCQFFGYKTSFNNLFEVFEMPEERATFQPGTEPWYIGWSNCVASVSKELRKHYTVPYFLEKSERTRDDWMFIGSPGYKGAPLHIDEVSYNSWQAQVRGRKKWTFTPPPECWYQCPSSHSIIVEPNNIFVFDSNRWFHSTEVLPGEYSLTIGAEYD